jgi:hypothetical protein
MRRHLSSLARAQQAHQLPLYLIDDPSPSLVPASQSLERIVRASYAENKVYERLASESLQRIKSGPLSKYFNESERHGLQSGWMGSQRKTFREINFEDLVGKYDDQPADGPMRQMLWSV